MHPDQQYSVRNLQHADLAAEAERERLARQAAPALMAHIFGRRGASALAGGAVGVAIALLAMVVMLPWNTPTRAQPQPQTRPINRIFADEMRYVPTIADYLAVLPYASAEVSHADARSSAVTRPASGQECQIGLLPGLLICTAGAPGQGPQSSGVLRLSGPR